jgi:uracil-DNA glycosylase family 4
MGFFAESEITSSKPRSLIPHCGACGLYKTCKTPKLPVRGKGGKRILIVGNRVSETDDEQGKHFAGSTGRELRLMTSKLGIDLLQDCWLTNALICHSSQNPTQQQLQNCLPNIINLIKELQPHVVIPMGDFAVQSAMSWLWDDSVGDAERWYGWNIPAQSINAWVCPTFHPINAEENKNKDLVYRIMQQQLEQACSHDAAPWQTIPDYKKQIEVIYDDEKVEKVIRSFLKQARKRDIPIAFDYETDRLKPDHPKRRIVSCSICFGGSRTIAFEWTKRTRAAVRRLLLAKYVRKIASNLKFEEGWTITEFGHGVENWFWDTMVNAHVLDNRKGITSIKFQAFVRFGQSLYNKAIEPYLKSVDEHEGGNSPNQIDKIDLESLLVYNGLDSLLEFLVAEEQCAEAGIEFWV